MKVVSVRWVHGRTGGALVLRAALACALSCVSAAALGCGGEAPGALSPGATAPASPAARQAASSAPATPAMPATAPVPPKKVETPAERAERLHEAAIIVDGHDDIPTVLFATGTDLDKPGKPGQHTHTDLARMKASGITGEFFSIYVDGALADKPTVRGGGSLRRAIDLIDLTYREVEKFPNDLVLATSADAIRKAKRDGKVAVLMGVEGGHAIENSMSALRELYRLGCRYMTLTHSNTNEWADSAGFSGPPPVKHHGLTPFGEDVVREMQRIGMLVDVSHVSDETFYDVMKVAKAPVIASHSSARAIADQRRNMSDDMLRALAKNGGVVMVNFWSKFLSNEYGAAMDKWIAKNAGAIAALRAKYKDDPEKFHEGIEELRAGAPPLPKVPISAIADHIDHIVKVAGVDHVGLGSDFDGVDSLPDGLGGIEGLPKITLELVERGYSDEDILKILGGNFLRVLSAAEAYAASTHTTLSGDGDRTKIDGK